LPKKATGVKVKDRDQGRDQGQVSVATGASRHPLGEGPEAGVREGAHGAMSAVPATGGKASGNMMQRATVGSATRAADLAITARTAECHAALVSEEEVISYAVFLLLSFFFFL
jgi:hypothetical protein